MSDTHRYSEFVCEDDSAARVIAPQPKQCQHSFIFLIARIWWIASQCSFVASLFNLSGYENSPGWLEDCSTRSNSQAGVKASRKIFVKVNLDAFLHFEMSENSSLTFFCANQALRQLSTSAKPIHSDSYQSLKPSLLKCGPSHNPWQSLKHASDVAALSSFPITPKTLFKAFSRELCATFFTSQTCSSTRVHMFCLAVPRVYATIILTQVRWIWQI